MLSCEPRLTFDRAQQYPAIPTPRFRIDLGGLWERHINGHLHDTVNVPASHQLTGYYQLKRDCMLPPLTDGQRAFLHFDSVHPFSRVALNNIPLGTTGPYVPYDFEVTTLVRSGTNAVTVSIADLQPEADGTGEHEIKLSMPIVFEAYSGIIRDTYMEYRPAAFIDNVRFGYTMAPPYGTAACRVELMLNAVAAIEGQVEVSLLRGTTVVAHAEQAVHVAATKQTIATQAAAAQTVPLTFDVHEPALWSPDTPTLYTLVARLRTAAGDDVYTCRTGFRDLRRQGRDFFLNNQRLILLGVNRHDMWKDQGFTLTRDQMRQDMQMIKKMGANFIRLVGYPQHRYVTELADELGILVTEETGQCNDSDFSAPRVKVILEILERLIRRDWNSPSVFGWNLGNECSFPLDFLKQGKALRDRLDPIYRAVGAADYETENHDAANLDYYTCHPYYTSNDGSKFEAIADGLGPHLPLIFDEGGWEPVGFAYVYERSNDSMLDVLEKGKAAGYATWVWADYRQYSCIEYRYGPGGVFLGGIVDEARQPREEIHTEMSRMFQRLRHPTFAPNPHPTLVPLRRAPWGPRARLQPIDLQALSGTGTTTQAWEDLLGRMTAARPPVPPPFTAEVVSKVGVPLPPRPPATLHFWQSPEVEIAGAVFQCPVTDGYVQPLVVTPQMPSLTIPIGHKCTALHVLGHVTLPTGFPVHGKMGQIAAVYTVRYASGAQQQIALRYGIEIAQANTIHDATRVNPIATAAPRALLYTLDPLRERYQVLLCSIPLKGGIVDRVHLTLNADAPPLLLFAMNTERA